MKNKFEEELNKIKVPEDLHDRCVKGIEQAKNSDPARKREAIKSLTDKWFAAAAIIICIAALVYGSHGSSAIAGSIKGFFRDITNRTGAVTGVEYENADKEVSINIVDAVKSGDVVTIEIETVFDNPEDIPFSLTEEISISDADIFDADGNKIADGISFSKAAAAEGRAHLRSEFNGSNIIAGEEYTIVTESITSHYKADAPMEMHGKWECKFTIE